MKSIWSHIGCRLICMIAGTVLVLGGCATNTVTTEIPFGTASDAGPLSVSTSWVDEGNILLTISSTAIEELKTDIRMRRATIGTDYGRSRSDVDPDFYSTFDVEKARRTLSNSEINDFTIQMKYLYQVSRPFYTIVYANVTGSLGKWKTKIQIDDEMLFTDVEYLRQLNRTDYWHPRTIQENWEKYLHHIGAG